MNMDNDELIIKNALNAVNTPEYDIASEIDKDRSAKKSPSFKRHLVTATVLLLLLTFTVAAAAATVSGFKYLMAIIGEENANLVTPVELSDEDQGIKMEVVAAGRFDSMLKVYVILQDLTGERLLDDVSFHENYNLTGIKTKKPGKGGGMSTAGWELIDYDKQNHKATLLYHLDSGAGLEGEELTIQINKLLYNTKEYWNYKVAEADLPNVDKNPPIFYASMNQFLSTSNIGIPEESLFQNYIAEDAVPVLKEQADKISFPQTEGFNICAMGIVDGKLHIQTRNFENEDKDTSYNIYFVDLKNDQPYQDLINAKGIFRFDLDENGNITEETDSAEYEEYVFDIDTDRLDEYELLAYISESDAINGNWEVKFNSEDSGEILKAETNVAIDGATVESAVINPFGAIRIEGTSKKNGIIACDVKINTSRGKITAISSGGSNVDNEFALYYETEKPIDLNSVTSLEINGRTVTFLK